jgi:hypothetical protein
MCTQRSVKMAQTEIDHHLLLAIMPKSQRRSAKRKRHQPEEKPSSASLEVIAVAQEGSRVRQNRVIEGTSFDPRASIFSPADHDAFSVLESQSDPFQLPEGLSASQKPLKDSGPDNPSRSVSVSLFRSCHVITC